MQWHVERAMGRYPPGSAMTLSHTSGHEHVHGRQKRVRLRLGSMSDSPVRCSLRAQAQREDKSFAAGVVRVTTHHVVFEAADGAPGSFAIHASHIAGAPQRNKPGSGRSLLRLPTSAGPRLLEFRDEAERDACTDAVLRAQRGESSHVSDPTRWKRLQEDPELQALHRDLVGGGVVGEEEFWRLHERHGGGQHRRQTVGFSSLLDAGLEKEVDQRTKREKYILKPEIAQQILAERPSVRKAYLENVPDKMDEGQFWNKYFRWRQRQLEKRRVEEVTATTFQGLMQEQAKDATGDMLDLQEDNEFRQQVSRSRLRAVDPTVNLANEAGDELPAGWGLREKDGQEDCGGEEEGAKGTAKFIEDINWHASVVLNGLPETQAMGTATEVNKAVAQAVNEYAKQKERELSDYAKTDEMWQGKQKELLERECIEDLREKSPEEFAKLRLKNSKAYFLGTEGNLPPRAANLQESKSCAARALKSVMQLDCMDRPITPRVAREVMLDYTNKLPRESGEDTEVDRSDDLEVPPQLRFSATKVNELLRFFWAMYPPKSNEERAKLERLKSSMDGQYDALRDHVDNTPSNERHKLSLIVNVLFQCLDAALMAYDDLCVQL